MIQNTDEKLRSLLRAGLQSSPAANPGFRAEVRARIEARREERISFRAWLRHHLLGFAGAASLSVVVFGIGGGWIAREQTQREREALAARYVQSIDAHQQVSLRQKP